MIIRALPLAVMIIAAAPPPRPFTSDERAQLSCVAALAIAAHGQRSGSSEGEGVPRLTLRGPIFAARVGEAVMASSAQPREAVRDAILGEVAALQARAATDDDSAEVARAAARGCTAMLDQIVPPPPLPVCAAALGLAADQARARDGLSSETKLLITFATVLEARAREALRDDGKSMTESDAIMGDARSRVAQQMRSPDSAEPIDIETCLERAKPDR